MRAYVLADGQALTVEQADSGLVVQLPRVPPSTIAAVIVLQVGGG